MSPPWVIHGDPESTGLPGTTQLWVSTAGKGAGANHPVAWATWGCAASGYKSPELLGWSGLRTKPCEAPLWVTQRVPPPGEGAGTKVHGCGARPAAVAGGRKGAGARLALSWGGAPGPYHWWAAIRCTHRPCVGPRHPVALLPAGQPGHSADPLLFVSCSVW